MGFQKIKGIFLEVPKLRMKMFRDLFLGSPHFGKVPNPKPKPYSGKLRYEHNSFYMTGEAMAWHLDALSPLSGSRTVSLDIFLARVWGLGFRVIVYRPFRPQDDSLGNVLRHGQYLGFEVWGLRFRVSGLWFGTCGTPVSHL